MGMCKRTWDEVFQSPQIGALIPTAAKPATAFNDAATFQSPQIGALIPTLWNEMEAEDYAEAFQSPRIGALIPTEKFLQIIHINP